MIAIDQLTSILKHRILVLDGAMGTQIQRLRLSEDDFRGELFCNHQQKLASNNDILVLSNPQIVARIHRSYLESGADIITTNTFNSNYISQQEFGTHGYVEQINFEAAALARSVADEFTQNNSSKPRFVAGSMGSTAYIASIINNSPFKVLKCETFEKAYYQQAKALIQGGVDILLVETVVDTLVAKAAFAAIERVQRELQVAIPVVVSATITRNNGCLPTGQSLQSFVESMLLLKPFGIGLNCSFGAEQIAPYIEFISESTNLCVSVHPNAGFPPNYQSPIEMSGYIENMLKRRHVNIVGGCCGTTPEHIAQIAKVASNIAPRTF